MSDRLASESDAAFREALRAFAVAVAKCERGIGGITMSDVDVGEARVLALYAERQGEVYEATDIHNRHGIRVRVIKVPPQEFGVGDRVRVTKVEEGQ